MVGGLPAAELAYRLARRLANLRIVEVLQLDLAAMHPSQPPALDLEYRFLSAAEVRAVAADPAQELDAAMAERLRWGAEFLFRGLSWRSPGEL